VASAGARLRAAGVRPEAALAAGPLRAVDAFSGVFGASAEPATLDAPATLQELRETATALRRYLRMLELVPDDEAAHLGAVAALVRAGRHAEAHRRYRVYAERMREGGIEPAPFPS
jgi:hypothetical protein